MPFPCNNDLGIVADVCKSFVFDNGAFTVWKKGGQVDVDGYTRWAEEWYRHPGFTWAFLPDVIDDEETNDDLIRQWPEELRGVPVWHLHESTERLQRLARSLGSFGQCATPGTGPWWRQMGAAMDAVCDEQSRPMCRLHGLRMLDPAIFQHLPFASADSTNAAVNGGSISRFGMYAPHTAGQRANVIADRIEAHNISTIWPREK